MNWLSHPQYSKSVLSNHLGGFPVRFFNIHMTRIKGDNAMVVTMVATPKMVAKIIRKIVDRKLFIKKEKVCF